MFYPVIDQEAYNLFDSPQLTGSPERRLLLAILERAILDYVGNEPQEVAEAEAWIFSDGQEMVVEERALEEFTFSWVCQQLDLETAAIAKAIRAMPRRGNNRVAPWYFMKANAKPHDTEKNMNKEDKNRASMHKVVQADFRKRKVVHDKKFSDPLREEIL